MSPHVTISDVASRAGVSIGAVSYALNGRKGVSEETRSRVLAVAEEMGWAPSSAARSLMESKTDTFGLVLARAGTANALGVDTFYMRFIEGIESELTKRSYALLLQIVPNIDAEVETHRRWRASRRVDGLIVVDVQRNDPRIGQLSRPGALPTVVSGDPGIAGSLMNVWTDDAAAMRECITYLAELGHRKISRISGIEQLGHTLTRDAAFLRETEQAGIHGVIARTDYSSTQGATATESVLAVADPPTAIIYDNDVMAIGGLAVASRLGVSVPDQLSIIAWDDSALCGITYPPLSAVTHDVVGLGAHVTRRLFDLIDGQERQSYPDSTPRLTIRGSTGPAPRS